MNRSMHILSGLLAIVAAGCTSTELPEPADLDEGKVVCAVPAEDADLVLEVLELINQERIAEGVAPVKASPALDEVAEQYACEMIEGGFFAHQNPVTQRTAGERLTAAGYIYYAMGEVLAVGQRTADEVVADWMASPDHREIILYPFWEECGLAVRGGGDRGRFWVQEFAEPVDLGE